MLIHSVPLSLGAKDYEARQIYSHVRPSPAATQSQVVPEVKSYTYLRLQVYRLYLSISLLSKHMKLFYFALAAVLLVLSAQAAPLPAEEMAKRDVDYDFEKRELEPRCMYGCD